MQRSPGRRSSIVLTFVIVGDFNIASVGSCRYYTLNKLDALVVGNYAI